MRKFYLLFSVVCCLILAGCQNAPKPDFTEKPHIVEKRLQLQKKLLSMLPEEKREAAIGVLSHDPRPSYQRKPDRVYGITFAGYDIRFTVQEDVLTVVAVEKV